MSQKTQVTCDCCGEEPSVAEAHLGGPGFHQVVVSFNYGSLSKKKSESQTLDLCDDCLQYATGESLHGGGGKLATALAYLVFKFVTDGLKDEAAKGRDAKPKEEKK